MLVACLFVCLLNQRVQDRFSLRPMISFRRCGEGKGEDGGGGGGGGLRGKGVSGWGREPRETQRESEMEEATTLNSAFTLK